MLVLLSVPCAAAPSVPAIKRGGHSSFCQSDEGFVASHTGLLHSSAQRPAESSVLATQCTQAAATPYQAAADAPGLDGSLGVSGLRHLKSQRLPCGPATGAGSVPK